MQWKAPNDIVYYHAKTPMKRVAESHEEQRATKNQFQKGSPSCSKEQYEGSRSKSPNYTAFEEIDSLMTRTYEVSLTIDKSHANDEEENLFLHHLQRSTFHLKESYKNFKNIREKQGRKAQEKNQTIDPDEDNRPAQEG